MPVICTYRLKLTVHCRLQSQRKLLNPQQCLIPQITRTVLLMNWQRFPLHKLVVVRMMLRINSDLRQTQHQPVTDHPQTIFHQPNLHATPTPPKHAAQSILQDQAQPFNLYFLTLQNSAQVVRKDDIVDADSFDFVLERRTFCIVLHPLCKRPQLVIVVNLPAREPCLSCFIMITSICYLTRTWTVA